MLGLASEPGAQNRVLGGHAYRAGVEVALSHHDAAGRDQRRRGEAELVCAQQGGDSHIPACTQAPVRLNRDARTQAIQQQGLLGFGEADLPG